MKANYHCHTKRCGHATDEMEDYVIAAINAGYDVLGFSDHAPFKGISQKGTRMEYEELDDYIAEFNYLKNKYKNKIELHLGLEIEYMPRFKEYYNFLLNEKGIEYLLLGQHCYFDENNNSIWYPNEVQRAKDTIEGMKSGYFTYCAHPDNFLNNQDIASENMQQLIKEVIETSIKYDVPLEINAQGVLNGIKHNNPSCYPFQEFWDIVGKSKAKVILGVDAHCASAFTADRVKRIQEIANHAKIKPINNVIFKK